MLGHVSFKPTSHEGMQLWLHIVLRRHDTVLHSFFNESDQLVHRFSDTVVLPVVPFPPNKIDRDLQYQA